MQVPFLDLGPQHRELRDEIFAVWAEIYDRTAFISGDHVAAFEEAYAVAQGVEYVVAVTNGTVALELALRAAGIGHGDQVLVPANTFIATAEAVSNVGAVPRFVDCDPHTRTISVDEAAAVMAEPAVRAALPVHLYGQPADLDPLVERASAHDVVVIEDGAQAQLARYRDRGVGSIGTMGCFSFYPGKNLGAPGEGGAVTTNSAELAERLRRLRDHGQERKYHSTLVGTNSRMIELVASALAVKLPHLRGWTEARRQVASWYREELADAPGVEVFEEPDWAWSAYHLFVVEVDDRDRVLAELGERGVTAALHYPVPVHLQEAYRFLGLGPGSFPHAERSASRVLSLPMFPELTREQVAYVASSLRDIVSG